MTVRIEKDGWVVSGTTLGDLQIGIKAVQGALESDGRVDLGRGRGRGRPRGTGGKTAENRRKKLEKRRRLALGLLQEVKKHPGGVLSNQVAKKLGINPRGIGNVFQAIEKFAETITIPMDEIFTRKRERATDPSVTLTPKERLSEALSQIEKKSIEELS